MPTFWSAYLVIVPVLLSAFVIFELVGIVWLWSRRSECIIRRRRPWTLCVILAGLTGFAVSRNVLVLTTTSLCVVQAFLPLFFLQLVSAGYIARASLLYLDSRIKSDCVRFINQRPDRITLGSGKSVVAEQSFVKIREWLSKPWALAGFIAGLFVIQAASLLVGAIQSGGTARASSAVYSVDPACTSAVQQSSVSELIGVIVNVALSLLVMYRLRNVQETLWIKAELGWTLVISGGAVALILVNLFSEQAILNALLASNNAPLFYILGSLVPCVALVYVTVYHVIYRSYPPKAISKAGSDPAIELLVVLNNDRGFDALKRFAERDLEVEAVLMWKDIQRFRERQVDPWTVYESYCADGAPIDAGLPAEIRADISAAFRNDDEAFVAVDAINQKQRFNEVPSTENSGNAMEMKERLVKADAVGDAPEEALFLAEVPDTVFDAAFAFCFQHILKTFPRFQETIEYSQFKEQLRQEDITEGQI